MEIKTKTLKRFLEKINAGCITDVICDFNETGMKVVAISPDNIVFVDSLLKKEAFTNYEAIGEIGLQSIQEIAKVIDKFGEAVNITVEGNLLTLKDKSKKAEVPLANIETMQRSNSPQLEDKMTESISIDSTILNGFVGDATVGGETDIIFETTPQKLLLKSTGKYKFEQTIEVANVVGGVTAKYGIPFFPAIAKLDGNVTLMLAKDFPVLLNETTEESIVKVIVAPKVENTAMEKKAPEPAKEETTEEVEAEESA